MKGNFPFSALVHIVVSAKVNTKKRVINNNFVLNFIRNMHKSMIYISAKLLAIEKTIKDLRISLVVFTTSGNQ